MSQDYYAHTWADDGSGVFQVLTDGLPKTLEAVVTNHSGITEPSPTFPRMLWADEGSGMLKIRNLVNDAWDVLGPLGQSLASRSQRNDWGQVSAFPALDWAALHDSTAVVTGIMMVTTGSTASSAGNELTFELRNATTAVDLFSGVVGTNTALAGVGGGLDLVAYEGLQLLPDQNAIVSPGDVLEFRMAITGAPTIDLSRFTTVLSYREGT